MPTKKKNQKKYHYSGNMIVLKSLDISVEMFYLEQPDLENLFLGFRMHRLQLDCQFLINVPKP